MGGVCLSRWRDIAQLIWADLCEFWQLYMCWATQLCDYSGTLCWWMSVLGPSLIMFLDAIVPRRTLLPVSPVLFIVRPMRLSSGNGIRVVTRTTDYGRAVCAAMLAIMQASSSGGG